MAGLAGCHQSVDTPHFTGYIEARSLQVISSQSGRILEQAVTEGQEVGERAFFVHIPAGFTRELVRGERPQLLVTADATDPAAASNAVSQLQGIVDSALRTELKGPLASLRATPSPVEVITHAKYNPEAITQYNIVPGLLGVILTMTSVMITAMATTREQERGNLENLQAMQMTFFFFLPSILLSGFMFPFRGMPHWAQMVGECLPLTHFLRVVRGIMLKGNDLAQLQSEYLVLVLFILAFGLLALSRYRRTLD